MSRLSEAAESLGLHLSASAIGRLETYRDLIASAAERFNLTAVRQPEAIEQRHLVESLALAALLEREGLLSAGLRVLDIGSGAGLPGLPIAIARPDLQIALLESNSKRCAFLREVLAQLELANVTVLEGRAEELGRDAGQREAYDLVFARAVAPLPVLIEYALPFLRIGGSLAATKGSAGEREVEESTRALSELGAGAIRQVAFEPPEGSPQLLVIIEKERGTPERYPRRAGIPSKRPLV